MRLRHSALARQDESMPRTASLGIDSGQDALRIEIGGRLDAQSAGDIWREALSAIEAGGAKRVIVDGSGLDYCDGSGIGLLIEMSRRQRRLGGEIEIQQLRPEIQTLLDSFDPAEFMQEAPPAARVGTVLEAGAAVAGFLGNLRQLVVFTGQMTYTLPAALMKPRKIRWGDAALIAERVGVNALPIIALIGFLLGLIMAFQAAIPMQMFGAEIYVADLIGISMVRELGPLMAAIILAGRTGSSFAAELGTMKVNEEIDALTTMGLDPVRFLIVPRVIAATLMMPVLSLFTTLFGLIGGAIVLISLGYPIITYTQHVQGIVGLGDLIGGLVKAFAFGILVAGIGCLRGLQTRTGASAVGESATSAVVSGITLIAIADGIFAVVFYYLGF